MKVGEVWIYKKDNTETPIIEIDNKSGNDIFILVDFPECAVWYTRKNFLENFEPKH